MVLEGTLKRAVYISPALIVLVSLLAAVTIAATIKKTVRFVKSGRLELAARPDIEFGVALITSVYAVIQLIDRIGLDLYPALYLLMTVLLFHTGTIAGLVCLAYSIAIEISLYFTGTSAANTIFDSASHVAFISLFASVYYILHWSEIWMRKVEHRKSVQRHINEMEEKALGYRLISSRKSLSGTEISDEDRRQRMRMSGVLVIQKSLSNQLQLLRTILKARTAAFLAFDNQDKNARILASSSESGNLRDGLIKIGEGLIGAVGSTMKPVTIFSPSGDANPCWYSEKIKTAAAIAVPVFEEFNNHAHLRGILAADRMEGAAFSTEETATVQTFSSEVMRTIAVEQIVLDMDKEKNQKEKFYEASRHLAEALTMTEVLNAAINAACTVSDYSFVAVTTVENLDPPIQKLARIHSANSDHEKLEGTILDDDACLAALVIKMGVPLPEKEYQGMERQRVFPPAIKLNGVESIKVLPLIIKKQAIGTITVGLSYKHHFDHEEMNMLSTVASMAAISIENGKLYEKMEQLATTDGLTGLYNHRVFQERLDEAIARAQRSKYKISLLILDIDHFKKINDSYGHPVGDQVLKSLAKSIKKDARVIDSVARYGGEEFTLILEDTDSKGSMIKAGRVLKSSAELSFKHQKTPFSITISIGSATFPDDAADKKELIKRADEALYHSKKNGRNQAWAWSGLKALK